jgi:hypothetical protein
MPNIVIATCNEMRGRLREPIGEEPVVEDPNLGIVESGIAAN